MKVTIKSTELTALRACAKKLRQVAMTLEYANRYGGGKMAVSAEDLATAIRPTLVLLDKSRGHTDAFSAGLPPDLNDEAESVKLLDECLPVIWTNVQNTLVERGLVITPTSAVTIASGAVYLGYVIASHHKAPMDVFQNAAIGTLAAAMSGEMDGVIPGGFRGSA